MSDTPTRKPGPRGDRPAGKHRQVWFTDQEWALLSLAAAVWRFRGTGEAVDPSSRAASASAECGRRVVPGLVRDVMRWANDETLPEELRQAAAELDR